MDPITHGTIGLALSAFSGQPVSLDNPVSIGCAIGAVMPDADAIIRIFSNDMVYLKHHRGMSHTAPFIAVMAAGVTGLLNVVYPGMNVVHVFLWVFLGGLSHTFFDILNSYGAKLFFKKRKASLLTLYDPFIALMALYLIFMRQAGTVSRVVIPLAFGGYLALRYYMRERAQKALKEHYSHGYAVERIDVLPSLLAFYKWDYIITARSHQIVGRYNQMTKSNKVIRKLRVQPAFIKLFNQTRAGHIFNSFSPNVHIHPEHHGDKVVLKVTDIRYFMRNRFMHHATVVLDKNHNIVESHIHPYRLEKSISISETM